MGEGQQAAKIRSGASSRHEHEANTLHSRVRARGRLGSEPRVLGGPFTLLSPRTFGRLRATSAPANIWRRRRRPHSRPVALGSRRSGCEALPASSRRAREAARPREAGTRRAAGARLPAPAVRTGAAA
ncbi:unnamed protein product [Rangifer tarandus platyrhynchus]|uniref:Uncharacterized protein n=2 Tax=Rangifer tarandus platyrhynchus TaxID=3082113 RepID=A0ABN8ZXZ8_RANTA|nr:unnamed protein product [Rangifer tarandus platyrhynchus]CAI9712227.1 unnamed protein product [Rangifer tarandus platyrhynchus]